jgi:hypothetical protein
MAVNLDFCDRDGNLGQDMGKNPLRLPNLDGITRKESFSATPPPSGLLLQQSLPLLLPSCPFRSSDQTLGSAALPFFSIHFTHTGARTVKNNMTFQSGLRIDHSILLSL